MKRKMENQNSGGLISERPVRKRIASRNYDENLMDNFIDEQLGGPVGKKIRTKKDLEKETEKEALIALSLGFPIDDLLEEEKKAGVVSELDGKEQNDYIVVRNHILVKWRENVHIWLNKGRIRETVSVEYEHLVAIAYDFLLSNGYINFGVSPSFVSNLPEEPREGSVIIVGAGLAGLAAARQLMSFGFKVSILEGRNRPGGRVYTEKMGWKGKFAAVDLGGSVITGIHANPLGVLARQLSIPLHKVRDKCPLYKPDGAPVDAVVDSRVELIFNKLLDKVTELRKIVSGLANDVSLGSVLEKLRRIYTVAKTKEEKQLLHWHFANLEYANAGCLSELSAAYWDQDDPYEMDGDHCFLAGGNWGMIRALCKGVPIFYGKTVETIKYGNEGVEVIAGDQLFQADMVLCTVPLGVLKRRLIRFEPELPEKKLEAIDRLGFGLLNKVAMVFPHVFWGEDLDTFGCLNNYSHRRGEYFLFYSYHTVSGGPVLIALVAGDAAQLFESTEPSTLVNRVMNILKGIYEPKGISVPDPIQSICTKWGSDPFSFGSYSHVRVQSSGSDYDILAENLGGRLFFAGEATIRQHPATMHGAYLSGLREASHIYRSMKARLNNPRKTVSKNVRPSNDVLEELFKNPDLAFGKFLFVFDPLTCDSKSLGLMRVTFGKSNNEFNTEEADNMPQHLLNPSLQLYTVVSREQARELQLVKEGNHCKLSDLLKGLGLKLVGANGLGVQGHSLSAKIVNARKGRKRSRSCTAKHKAGNSNSQLP
nr:lysine-specific histone demethylase 1 homolog 2-like [Solanum lycopersicum]XP_025887929.1 lysine-specific histone demethylase 1 homolog 2-like [Solanum lycopersicum]XP_025887930.1 lysine-specific histone demethylase 1 homolog 2-like [Solanum lycopersicum]XP_025887931.1 lysine-specific histone demethylase 1 homolog 2-like [Solanum lycopersicum]XP_025887932.1 lysine-specific histone demethylase 1 homolog 2-like [Solanum lycopersicum]XP_025887933.1 lysine-specific histone demethylase 1 homolog